ncbi:hypothetical protein [Paenibacillus agaridevorans]|nr:hypothetical protein [Paenibacillus agaridevorans]
MNGERRTETPDGRFVERRIPDDYSSSGQPETFANAIRPAVC